MKSLLLLLLCLITISIGADEKKSRRIMVGIKLFPAVIAADYQLAEKIDGQGYLSLLILHQDKPMLAEDLADRLTHIKKIRDLPVKVEVSTFDDFINGKTSASIAVFLAQSPDNKINKILDRATSSSVLLFSPFKGDVEKGIHSGFVVSDRILPHVNLKTIEQSRIKLKAFFLRVSRHYD
ncbi:MAG: YfiR family protein [Gammaproteobacteria bacterium]|nr:YfiR family protein [Gammaproteobacteria bacterium]